MPDKYEAELPDEIHEILAAADKDREIRLTRVAIAENLKFLNFVRSKVKDVPLFWAVTLLSHPELGQAVSSSSDKEALKFLTDVELLQDPHDTREYEIVFHFKENPFFTNAELRKKFALPTGTALAPADGTITDEMRAFEATDLEPTSMVIDWKEGNDLIAKYPRKLSLDEDGIDGDIGSFFHFFTEKPDIMSLGGTIVDVLAEPLEFFANDPPGFDSDFDEEDDEDEGSIDLGDDDEEDQPQRKKQKKD
ncbi:hypothetical protein CspeluHIS016_0700910 [Cutaneotrichosporon spelunceum]|uniref:Template-activating factor I n=1 Tax=Cutaneotrichosporon spelunceum TaxID=1672016 RepID=A0AAD3YDF9_9TREE|nr:hypothetical protein CspeluHIS016_0700910 [Cutaneotrichosporon spelunceum]